MHTVVNMYEAKTQLSALVDQAAGGEDVIIARNGKPQARITATPGTGRVRSHGPAALASSRSNRMAVLPGPASYRCRSASNQAAWRVPSGSIR